MPHLPFRGSLLATLGTSCLVACASSETRGPVATAAAPACAKVGANVIEGLRTQPEGARMHVVVELSQAPRERDVLQAGVADCVSSPSMGTGGSLAAGLPWGEREIALPSSLPVTCLAWASIPQIDRWCSDPTVRSVDALE